MEFAGNAKRLIVILLSGGPVAGAVCGGILGRGYQINGLLSSSIGFIGGFGVAIFTLIFLVVIERFVNRSSNPKDTAINEPMEEKG